MSTPHLRQKGRLCCILRSQTIDVDESRELQMMLSGPVVPPRQGEPRQLVVLLHGWGADGDDLVPLARALARPRTRFIVPEAPLARGDRGRAWWHLGGDDRPQPATGPGPGPEVSHPDLLGARRAIQAIVRTLREQQAPERLCLAGFSQGAMLALDVALSTDPPVDCVAVLSGALLRDSLPGLAARSSSPPEVLLAHGRQDPVLPYDGAERARSLLGERGLRVRWLPFEGGHSIPREVREELRRFLFASPAGDTPGATEDDVGSGG
jgi:phospholipase/carboxylesterase